MNSKILLQFLLFHCMATAYAMEQPKLVNLKDLEESILYLSDVKSQNQRGLPKTNFTQLLSPDLFNYFLKNYFIINPLDIKQIIRNNKYELLQTILKLRLKIIHDDSIYATPLHMAAEYDAAECLDVFLKNDQKYLNCPDLLGCTPLHCAAMFCSEKSLQILLHNKSILINCQCYNECTPLHLAASASICYPRKPYKACVKLLLENNADPNIQDQYHYMADDIHLTTDKEIRNMIAVARKSRKKKDTLIRKVLKKF